MEFKENPKSDPLFQYNEQLVHDMVSSVLDETDVPMVQPTAPRPRAISSRKTEKRHSLGISVESVQDSTGVNLNLMLLQDYKAQDELFTIGNPIIDVNNNFGVDLNGIEKLLAAPDLNETLTASCDPTTSKINTNKSMAWNSWDLRNRSNLLEIDNSRNNTAAASLIEGGGIDEYSNHRRQKVKEPGFQDRRRKLIYLNFCTFCKSNNEPKQVYESHVLQVNGVKTCPALKECFCAHCGRKGHTMSHCFKKVQWDYADNNSSQTSDACHCYAAFDKPNGFL